MLLAQSVSSYFFWEQPKQLFVGAELCARWYQLLKGDLSPKTASRVISYSKEGQEVFSWILAGQALSTLAGRVISLKWDADTTAALSESLAHSAACGDIVIDKLFESKTSRFKVLGFAADTLGDMVDLRASMTGLFSRVKTVATIVKSFVSIFLTLISAGIYFGTQTYVLPGVSLVLETTAFITKIVHFNNTFEPKKNTSH